MEIPEHEEVTVADEDGDPVVFDPASIPDETKLFLGVAGGDYVPEIEPLVREEDWRKWDSTENGATTNDSRTVSFSNETGFAYSKVLPASGKHLVWLHLSQAPCCIAAGPIPASRQKIKCWGTNENPHMIYVMSMAGSGGLKDSHTGGAGNHKPVRMGIYMDLDLGEVVYFNQEEGQKPRYGQKMKFLPSDVKLAVSHPKHGISITFGESKEGEIDEALMNYVK